MIFRFLSKALLVAVLGLLLVINEARTEPCSGPFIRQKLQNLTTVVAAVGEDVKLPCWVNGGRRLFWLKNNKTLHVYLYHNLRVKNRYLKINKVRKEDEGSYTCVASNGCGSTDSFTWIVSLAARPSFTVSPHKLVRNTFAVPVGNSVKLDCSAEGHPRPTVRWYKDGALFRQRRGGSRLYLSPWKTELFMKELVPTDTGKYTCNVSNAYGWINHTYLVDVHERARAEPVVLPIKNVTVYEGENATLLCKALSDSMPHFQWLRWPPSNGSANSSIMAHPHYEVIKQNDQHTNQHLVLLQSRSNYDFHGVKLTLVNVSKSDAGKYSCIVGNAVGYAIKHGYIVVYKRSDKQQVQSVSPKHITTSHLDEMSSTSGQEQESEKSANKTSKTSRFQYPKVLIGVLAGVVVLLIIAFGLCYWQVKTSRRAYSSTTKSRRPEIDSLRAKHEVQNEYVVVPDFKRNT